MRAIEKETCAKRFYRIDRREIHFLKFILEGYGGLATVSTLDAEHGLVLVRVAPGCDEEVNMVLGGLGKDMMIENREGPIKGNIGETR